MIFVRLLLRILACLIRPPWGIMFLVSGIIVAIAAIFGKGHLDDFQSQSLYFQLEKSKNDQKSKIARKLSQSDDAGICLLVRGLTSKEEATALACQNALKELIFEWRTLSNNDGAPRYLVLSNELEEISKTGSQYSQQLVHELAVMVQQDVVNHGFEGQRVVSQNCRKVIEAWQAGQRDPNSPVKVDLQNAYQTTLASAGEPRNARFSGINVPYLVAESTTTEPNDRLRQLADQRDLVSSKLPDDNLSGNKNQTGLPKEVAASPRVGFYGLQTPSSAPVPVRNDTTLIVRELPKTSPFLTDRLQQVAVRDLPKLPTQDLMRLLNHTNRDIVRQAEAILKSRDGFEEEHIQLAGKLYHPAPAVRKSLLSQLAENEQLETASWLSELLQDPDQEVRLATARAIYGQIPLDEDERERLKTIMQSDADQRVAAIGQGMQTRIY